MPVRDSSKPGPSLPMAQHMVGDAVYAWCRKEHDFGYVFQQEELLASNIIPNRDVNILVGATQYLVSKHLLKLHDIKGQEGVGWELVSPDIAQSYDGLTSDEQMVYASIESAGAQGIWTKTIKAKSGVHAKVLDRVYKSLESRQLIKQMKSVKNPGRKMYILFGLQPSEEATGGAWFTEGRLDVDMIEAITTFVEYYCSRHSWREIKDDDSDQELAPIRKRKQPDDGFGADKGKAKASKLNADMPETNIKARKNQTYEPYEPGYTNYPTIREISKAIIEGQVIESGQALPDNALLQLLDVMVYDDKLYKMYRDSRSGEIPDVTETNQETSKVIMYRSFVTPSDWQRGKSHRNKLLQGSRSAARQQELEDIGLGGTSEVPCLGCPNFDICGNGGQINAETCVYLEQWFKQMEMADRDVDDPWPSTQVRPSKSSASRPRKGATD